MWSNIKISDRIVYFWLQGDSEEAEFQRPSSLIAATKSGASGLAERTSMMPFGSCICRATWRQPVRLQLDAPQKSPNANRRPSICVGKKDIVGERGLLKTAFPMKLDRKKPPPPGGFPIYNVPSSRTGTVSKRTPLEEFVPGASRGVLGCNNSLGGGGGNFSKKNG